MTQISKGSKRYPNQCTVCVWQEERERGRRASSFSAGRLAPELLLTLSINVVSSASNARFDCNYNISDYCGYLEAARLQCLL